jgi:GAF domain-containing protein/HAMP domain-containing protein
MDKSEEESRTGTVGVESERLNSPEGYSGSPEGYSGSLRWAVRIGAVGVTAAAIFNLAGFVQTGAWQMLVVLAAVVAGGIGLMVTNRLASQGRLEVARNVMLASMVVAFASGELMHSGLTWYLGAGGMALVLLVGLLLVPGRWWTSAVVAAGYGGYVALVNWLEPLPRYDVHQLGLGTDVFVIALLGFLIGAALFLVARFYQRLMSIRVRLPVSFMLVVLGTVLVIASVGAVVGSQGGRRQALTQLESVARMKEAEIDQWIGRVETELDAALAGGQLTPRMVLILDTPDPTDTELFYPRNYLQYAAQESDYFDDFALLDREGNVRLFTALDSEEPELVREAELRQGLEGFHLQPLLYAAERYRAPMVAMRPIRNEAGESIGVLAGIVDTWSLSELLGERAWLGATGEMYLIDRNRRLLTDLRFSHLHRILINTQLESLGVASQADASMVYADYRGEEVVGVLHWLPALDMILVAKQDTAESAAVTRQLMRVIGLVAAGAFVVAVGVSLFVTRGITGPLAELTETAGRIAGGDLSLTPALAQRDEIGTLSRAFGSMTTQLRELIASLERRVADRTHELAQRSSYLEASAEVGRAATSILDPNQLIREVVELIRERFGLYYVGLFLVQESEAHGSAGAGGEWAVLRAGTGRAGELMLKRGHRIQVGTGLIGWSIAHAQSRVAEEAQGVLGSARGHPEGTRLGLGTPGEDDPGGAWGVRLATAELPDTRSEAALPLRSRGQVLGAITVQDTRPAAFDEDMMAVLQTMADQVAVAIDNAHLFEESQRALQAEQQAYGQISRQAWMRMIEAVDVKGYRCDDVGVGPAGGELSPLSRRAMAERRLVLTEPARQGDDGNGAGKEAGEDGGIPGTRGEGARAEIAIPIMVRDAVLGVLHFRKEEADRTPWSREQVALVEGLAEQLGQALESARLYQDSQLRAGQERVAAEVTGRMRESLDVQKVLQTAAREMQQVFNLAEVELRIHAPGVQGSAPGVQGSAPGVQGSAPGVQGSGGARLEREGR